MSAGVDCCVVLYASARWSCVFVGDLGKLSVLKLDCNHLLHLPDTIGKSVTFSVAVFLRCHFLY